MVTAGALASAEAQVPAIHAAGQVSLADAHTVSVVFANAINPEVAYDVTLSGGVEVEEASAVAGTDNLLLVELAGATPLSAGMSYTIEVSDPAGGDSSSRTFEAFSVESEVANIRAAQLPGGGFSTNRPSSASWQPGQPIRIVPYFACISAMGLLYAHRITGEASLLEDARRYADWHGARLQPNGTITDYIGFYPNYDSTGDYDSSDSYGALYLMLHWLYQQETEDAAYLTQFFPWIETAASAMDLTYEPDNLTWAKPTWRVKYTMDNVEVFQGYFAAARLAQAAGEEEQYTTWLERSRLVREAVHKDLYVHHPSPGRYSTGKGESGRIFAGWDVYYPDAMANEYAIFYAHLPGEAQAASAWQTHRAKFFANGLPPANVSWSFAGAALRMRDEPAFLASMPAALENHRQYRYAHHSGMLLHLTALTHEIRLRIPAVEEAPSESAGLDASQWRKASRLRFHPLGEMVGFDNRETYEFPKPNPDPDALHTLYFLQVGPDLHVGLHAWDRWITTAGAPGDSDGLSVLAIRGAQDPSTIHPISATFHPNEGDDTVPVPRPEALFTGSTGGSLAHQILSSEAEPNNPEVEDEGYFLHLRVPLDHPAAGGFPQGIRRFTFGVRIADMDGIPEQPWPWENGAFGRMMQLTEGLQPASYTVNTAELEQPIPERLRTFSDQWIILGE